VRKTRLYERHIALGARMIDFGGWLLPVQYPTGPIEEHHRVRRAAGIFDIDHMGQLVVEGSDSLTYLQYLVTTDVSTMEMGEARYSLICYDDGGVVDDVFIYRLPDRYFIAINAANREKDYRWFDYHAIGYDVDVRDVSEETYMLALQGPKAEKILQELTSIDLSKICYHTAVEGEVAGVQMLLGRTGYTGEDGFELFFPAEHALRIWDVIIDTGKPLGLSPIGLAARDSLRFEPCMPLYGQEIAADLDPISAGLGWAVSFAKGVFIGREALLKTKLEGPTRRLVAFEMLERSVPRHGYPVLVDGNVAGVVTTGMYAPTVGKYAGMAYVPTAHSAVGSEIAVLIRDKPRKAIVVRRPFYIPAYRRQGK